MRPEDDNDPGAGQGSTGGSSTAMSDKSAAPPGDHRRRFLVASALLFVALTCVAAIREVRLDALQPAPPFSYDWWFDPLEINPGKRMPVIDSDLSDVFALEDGRYVWAVGAKGLIVHSTDGGRTWVKQRIEPMAAGSPPQQMPVPNEPQFKPSESGANASPARSVRLASMQEKSSRPPDQNAPNRPARNPATQADLPDCETDADCDDGMFCNGVETCAKGYCVAGRDPCDPIRERCNEGTNSCERPGGCRRDADCDDGDACTEDSCLLNLGSCMNQPVRCPTGKECDPSTGKCEDMISRPPGLQRDLNAIWMTDALTGWAVGDHVIMRCEGGRWSVASREPIGWSGVKIASTGQGWAFGNRERGTDLGAPVLMTLPDYRIVNLEVGMNSGLVPAGMWLHRDGNAGVCIAQNPPTSDGAATALFRLFEDRWSWVVQPPVLLSSVDFDENGRIGWGVGPEVAIRFGENLLPSDQLALPGIIYLGDVWVAADGTAAIAVGSINTTLRSDLTQISVQVLRGIVYRNITPEQQPSAWIPLDPSLLQCPLLSQLTAAADERHFWAAGVDGTLIASADGGASWFYQSRPSDEYISSRVRSQFDGPYARLPAPWYYVSLLLPVFLLVQARRPRASTTVRTGIADKLTSDRPLREGDPDPLDIGQIARGVANFLHNRKTEPPMTLAVTGMWGTGKSSLMNLIRAKLDSRGNPTVWFNAWHHQKEEHLLAALLETVRAQAVPAWWSLDGAGFRLRLLWLRGRKNPGLVAAMLLVFAVCSGYIAAQLMGGPTDGGAEASSGGAAASKSIWSRIAELSPDADWLALVGVVFPPLVTLLKGFRAFGVSPGKLMSAATGSADSKDLEAQAGFRSRFSREFDEVTEALKPARLSVFIDDLDRCRPQNVLDALEAINFLISAGECFVVLGIDRDQVTRCVALAFKDVASELAQESKARRSRDNSDVNAAGASTNPAHLEFARHYMEKLINIEVKVPQPTPSSAVKIAKLLRPKTNEQEMRDSARRRMERRKATLRSVSAVSAIVALLAGGTWLGGKFGTTVPEPEPQIAGPSEESKLPWRQMRTDEPAADSSTETASSDSNPFERRAARGKGTLDEGEKSHLVWWAMSGLPVLVFLGLWGVKRGHVELIDDSRDFAEALERWLPLVASARNKGTPRAVKRFVNSVRYYEMLQPPGTDETTTKKSGRVPVEPLIVMAAGSELNPEWCRSGELRRNLQAALNRQIVEWERYEQTQPRNGASVRIEDHMSPASVKRKLDDVIANVDEPAIARFRMLAEGVRVGGIDTVPVALAETSTSA